jgi:hypothetical protein
MRRGIVNYGSNQRKFFFSDLTDKINVEDLLLEAYILVNKCHFSYSDVKTMTKLERALFIKFYTKDLEAQKNAIEQHTSK